MQQKKTGHILKTIPTQKYNTSALPQHHLSSCSKTVNYKVHWMLNTACRWVKKMFFFSVFSKFLYVSGGIHGQYSLQACNAVHVQPYTLIFQPRGPNFFLSRMTPWKKHRPNISFLQTTPIAGNKENGNKESRRKVWNVPTSQPRCILPWSSKKDGWISVKALFKLAFSPEEKRRNMCTASNHKNGRSPWFLYHVTPLGGSFVTLTEFCSTLTGKKLVGMELRNRRKSSWICALGAVKFFTTSSNDNIHEAARWQF